MSSEGKWLINLVDDGDWSHTEEFNTKEDAVAYGRKEFDEIYESENGEKFNSELYERIFYVGKMELFAPTVCAYSVTERIEDHAYDEVGEFASDLFYNVSKKEYELLEHKLNKALNEWLDETKNHPTFFKVVEVEEGKI